MSFPTITFKHTNTDVDEQLETLVETKFDPLEKYLGDETAVLCEVEFERETAHNSGNHFRVEANLSLAGKLYRAVAKEQSFEEAIDTVRDELDKELRRAHKKHDTMVRRGGRAIKRMMRLQ